jgi:peroxiredoxin
VSANADTPGCTTQACAVRDHRPDYDEAERYGVWVEKSRGSWGNERTTFVIDEQVLEILR